MGGNGFWNGFGNGIGNGFVGMALLEWLCGSGCFVGMAFVGMAFVGIAFVGIAFVGTAWEWSATGVGLLHIDATGIKTLFELVDVKLGGARWVQLVDAA